MRRDNWAGPTQLALWIGCSSQLISKFVLKQSGSMGFDFLDTLAFLTGVYPPADTDERRARFMDAERWHDSSELQDEYEDIIDYLRKQHSGRELKKCA